MKRNKLSAVMKVGVLSGLSLALTACSTSAFENADIFVSEVGDTVKILTGSSSSSGSTSSDSSEEETSSGTPLSSPANFTVDDDGNYSFDGVDGADYYMIYFCEPGATEDSDNYLFSSANIEDDGSETYTGSCFELFDYAYGEYLAKVSAFPDIADTEYEKSAASTCDYVFSGEQSLPQICYLWDIFSQTFSMQISNIDDYLYQAYPDEVQITFTDSESGDVALELVIEDVSADNYSIDTTALSTGVSYDITAIAVSSSEFVTNQTTDAVEVGQIILGEDNQMSDEYSYHDGIKAYFGYPLIETAFNLEEGGSAGEYSGIQGVIYYTATPTDVSDGSAYSYDVIMEPPGFMKNVMGDTIAGALELYSDGTFMMSQVGGGPLSNGTIQGTWTENGDGTATLNYDHSTVTEG